MNYATIKKIDIANGIGIRTSLFVSGCRNHCKGCFNPETWDFKFGEKFTEETKKELIRALGKPFIKGLSLLGGDPMEKENQQELVPFIKEVKKLYPNKDIWCYSGYLFEKLKKDNSELLPLIDILVDGPFILEKKNLKLRFRGSENQRIIDVQASLQTNEIVLYKEAY